MKIDSTVDLLVKARNGGYRITGTISSTTKDTTNPGTPQTTPEQIKKAVFGGIEVILNEGQQGQQDLQGPCIYENNKPSIRMIEGVGATKIFSCPKCGKEAMDLPKRKICRFCGWSEENEEEI